VGSWLADGRTVRRRAALGRAVLGSIIALAGQQLAVGADLKALDVLAAEFGARFEREHADAVQWLAKQGIGATRTESADGQIVELMVLRNGRPVYYMTENVNAADTVSTDEVQVGGSSPYDLDGAGVRIHLWDGGSVLGTHQELSGKISFGQQVGLSSHSTHVAGTMIATGVVASAHGMADQATIKSYDFNNDDAEMVNQGGIAILSNHSYGTITGWFFGNIGLGTGNDLHWFGDVTVDPDEDANFGRYTSGARDWDAIAFSAPHWLILKSAGNDRNDTGPAPGTLHWHLDGGWVQSTDTHPPDGGSTGYDTIPTNGTAKNILTVGAVADILGGYTTPGGVLMASFSGWGPTDDGRIKPDVAANGISLTSCSAVSNGSYSVLSGTSMSTPNATGSLALLVQQYRSLHGGADMRSATLKGLVLHAADEAGSSPGPDYSFGWGLLNSLSAANLIDHAAANPEAIQELTLGNGQTVSQVHTYNGAGPFKATICWTDPPGTAVNFGVDVATRRLVNDLDLRVIGPTGTEMPWVLDPANPGTAAARGDNDRDNIESVLIASPLAGDYTVEISHKGSITSQQVSLILSGVGSNPIAGACCRVAGRICSQETREQCDFLGGTYAGTGLPCTDANGDGVFDHCMEPGQATPSFAQTPDGTGEAVASNMDGTDDDPATVVTDDFISDGRAITGVRWWGGPLGASPPDPDGWFISFHAHLAGADPAGGALGVYFCPRDAVSLAQTIGLSCDAVTVSDHIVDLGDCCLLRSIVDPRTGSAPASPAVFQEYACVRYDLGVQAVVGRNYMADGDGLCVPVAGSEAITGDFWGWHTTGEVVGAGAGLRSALVGPVSTPADDLIYGPWSVLAPACSDANMAFETLTTEPGDPEADGNGDGVADFCDFFVPDAPAADPGGITASRFGAFAAHGPAAGGTGRTAVRVMLTRLYVPASEDPDSGCPDRTTQPDLSQFESEVRWLGPAGEYPEFAAPMPNVVAAELQCCPYFRDWSQAALTAEFGADAETSLIHFFGPEVVPCSEYTVQLIDQNCVETMDEECFSAPLTVRTGRWGDCWSPYGGSGQPSFLDINAVVNKYKGIAYAAGPPESGGAPLVRAMSRGNVVPVGEQVNFLDIGNAVSGYKKIPYGEAGPVSCPSCN